MQGRWWIGGAFVLAACHEPTPTHRLRTEEVASTHRRAVFQLRRGAFGLAASGSFAGLEDVRARAAAQSRRVQPDLTVVQSRAIPVAWTEDEARSWAETLDAEWVVLRLEPVASPADIPPETPSFVGEQSYRDAQQGIGADPVLRTGVGVAIHEVEYGWRSTHEDLVDVDLHPEPGQTTAAAALSMGLAPEHGTASVGMLVAPHNGYGIDGLIPDAAVFTYPEWSEEGGLRRAEAVAAAIAAARPGDIVMLQMQAQHPQTGQFGPAELDPDVWMMTRMAVDAGVVVIAAAGNGALDLDGPETAEYRARGDSGAILVGAGNAGNRAALPFSTYGERVDLQGWGEGVFTLGYGDHAQIGGDDDQAYTASFEGTSAALPMVVGAAAMLIEAFAETDGEPPRPEDVRRLLVATGRAHAEGRHVGPLPNVGEALSWVGAREDDTPYVDFARPDRDIEVPIDLGGALELEVDVSVEDSSPVYRVELEVDDAPPVLLTGPPPFVVELRLDEGEHELRARATDVWGNVSDTVVRSVVATVEAKPGGSSSDDGGTEAADAELASASEGDAGCSVSARPQTRIWLSVVFLVSLFRRKKLHNVGVVPTPASRACMRTTRVERKVRNKRRSRPTGRRSA